MKKWNDFYINGDEITLCYGKDCEYREGIWIPFLLVKAGFLPSEKAWEDIILGYDWEEEEKELFLKVAPKEIKKKILERDL